MFHDDVIAQVEAALAPHLPTFFFSPLLEEESNTVKCTLESVKAICHTRPLLFSSSLSPLFSSLFQVMARKKEIVKMFGPVKHIEDEEESNRLLAYECMDLLLTRTQAAAIPVDDVIRQVFVGSRDFFYVRLKCLNIFIHLAHSDLFVDCLALQLPSLATLLHDTLDAIANESESASQKEKDASLETAKTCVKVIAALLGIPRIRANLHWKKLVAFVQSSNTFSPLLAEMLLHLSETEPA
jgi:hypothetical protein